MICTPYRTLGWQAPPRVVIMTLQSPSKGVRATAGAAIIMHPTAKAGADKYLCSRFVRV
jgi:hypothetical protein